MLWYAQKQLLVATSTAEAEYRAAVSAVDEISLSNRIGCELGILHQKPTMLFVDNQSAIHMLKNVKEGKVTKGKKKTSKYQENLFNITLVRLDC